MPNYYIYLISSLPMLHFAARPALTLKGFLSSCADLLNPSELTLIQQAISTDAYALNVCVPTTLLKWKEFDLSLRNELARARAIRKKIPVEKFLRPANLSDINITHIAQAAIRNPSILEAEKYLDLERWKVLDEISSGHYFDLDFLLVYALKLVILERWEKINFCDKTGIIEKVLAG
ncbi:MAG: DUF2764 family protein [Candidatus Omnitrophica bacterium]|jgi:hypothetical protein|nr:DUF2764 family protein [Candidatus Omnitrophota bacterium]